MPKWSHPVVNRCDLHLDQKPFLGSPRLSLQERAFVKPALAAFAILAAASGVSHAQLGFYAGFSSAKLDVANTNRTNGGTFGAYFDSHHFPLINFGLDLRAVVANSDDTTQVTSGMAGPRAVFHLPLVPLHPYVEGLVGGAHVQTGQGIARYDGTNVAAGAAAGVDFTILPYVDWRVIDYNYTRLPGPETNQNTITTGIVIRIPFS